jgi:hypothetical protein
MCTTSCMYLLAATLCYVSELDMCPLRTDSFSGLLPLGWVLSRVVGAGLLRAMFATEAHLRSWCPWNLIQDVSGRHSLARALVKLKHDGLSDSHHIDRKYWLIGTFTSGEESWSLGLPGRRRMPWRLNCRDTDLWAAAGKACRLVSLSDKQRLDLWCSLCCLMCSETQFSSWAVLLMICCLLWISPVGNICAERAD